MKNQIQLITYVDRLTAAGFVALKALVDGPLDAGNALIVDVDETDDMRRRRAARPGEPRSPSENTLNPPRGATKPSIRAA